MSETGVRNGVLGRLATSAGGWVPIFTVPAATTVLLKAVHVHNGTGAAIRVVVLMAASDGSSAAYLPEFQIEADAWAMWEGWTALNEGDQLQAVLPGLGPVQIWAAGAALPGSTELLPIGELVRLSLVSP